MSKDCIHDDKSAGRVYERVAGLEGSGRGRADTKGGVKKRLSSAEPVALNQKFGNADGNAVVRTDGDGRFADAVGTRVVRESRFFAGATERFGTFFGFPEGCGGDDTASDAGRGVFGLFRERVVAVLQSVSAYRVSHGVVKRRGRGGRGVFKRRDAPFRDNEARAGVFLRVAAFPVARKFDGFAGKQGRFRLPVASAPPRMLFNKGKGVGLLPDFAANESVRVWTTSDFILTRRFSPPSTAPFHLPPFVPLSTFSNPNAGLEKSRPKKADGTLFDVFVF